MLPVLPHRRIERGFTLIEVLVALAVIAIGLVAVLAVAARSGRVDSELQQRTFAAWVASNQMERMRLASNWPGLGKSDGKITLADQDWHWKATVDKTEDPDLRRVTLSVATEAKPDDPVIQLLGFLGKPSSSPGSLPGSGANPTHPDKGGR
ncbi:MAG: type II secretion system minor pseudopilin GspI [Gammaproteobacteria bacterium]